MFTLGVEEFCVKLIIYNIQANTFRLQVKINITKLQYKGKT